jgi:hypothetical protein
LTCPGEPWISGKKLPLRGSSLIAKYEWLVWDEEFGFFS